MALFFSGIRILTPLCCLSILLAGFWISDWGIRDGFQLPKTMVLGLGAIALATIVSIGHAVRLRRTSLPLEIFLLIIFASWCFFSAWWGVSYVHAAAPLAILASSIGWWGIGWMQGAVSPMRSTTLLGLTLGGAGVGFLGLAAMGAGGAWGVSEGVHDRRWSEAMAARVVDRLDSSTMGMARCHSDGH